MRRYRKKGTFGKIGIKDLNTNEICLKFLAK